jgi:hypothetical protein
MAKKSIQRDAKAEQKRLLSLRHNFCVSQIEDHIQYFRFEIPEAIPGEVNYKRSLHIEALRQAIVWTKNKKTRNAGEYIPDSGEYAFQAECEARFDATMRQIAARDPFISEAYLGSARMRSQLHLVRNEEETA